MNIFLANAYIKQHRAEIEADAANGDRTAKAILALADRVRALVVATPNADLIRRDLIVAVQKWQNTRGEEMPA